MKKIFTVILLSILILELQAQPPYPTAPAVSGVISALEYFIDETVEAGAGTSLSGFTPSQNINGFTGSINLTGVSAGFHRIYFRSKDITGKWSLTNNAFFDNYTVPVYNTAPASVTNIIQLEYFLDNQDLGFGNCIPISITPGSNLANLNATINISGLSSGAHTLYIRSKDASGKWSLTNFSFFDNSLTMPYPAAVAPAPPVTNMEYYIDNDPGFGNATAVTFPANSGNISNYAININLSGSLSAGTHYLYIRSKQNPWSLTTVVPFSAGNIVPVLWSYVKAQLINKQALLSWATAQEINAQKFEIEHSTDGRTFVKIGAVAAAENTNSGTNYSFTHLQPIIGINYYRIKQIDNDGGFTYSAIVSVLLNSNLEKTLIAPNPVNDVLNLIEPKPVFVNTVTIYNTTGSLLLRKAFNSPLQVYSLYVNNLPAGRYLVRVVYKNETKTYPFIKE